MKNFAKNFISLLLIFVLTLSVVSCGKKDENNDGGDEEKKTIKITTLNGTTGFGMARLTEYTDKYTINVESDANVVTASIINGETDIAALPTNAAANLYAKTGGKVKILAVNTLGVLYVVTDEENSNIKTLSDLEGKTVYCPAQNPTFIFKGLCSAAGINVTVDNSFAQPADLRTALVSGQVGIAVLPEPMVTIAQSKNSSLSVAVDLTKEWNKVFPESSLMQGCVVARTEFIEKNPDTVKAFLNDYKSSIEFVNQNPEDASSLIAESGIFDNAAVAQKAIPKCNISFVDGESMAYSLDTFFSALYAINPQSVGGAVPDAGIYYKPND